MTEILSKAGAKTVAVGDEKLSGRRLLARLLWEGVTTGIVKFPDGTTYELAATDWRAMVEFIYKHIDGPPVQGVDLTSGGEKLTIEIVRASSVKTDSSDQ